MKNTKTKKNEIKKILILSEFFYPDKSSTPKVLTELAEDFVKNGLNVDVITSMHSYKGQSKLSNNDKHSDITIHRVSSTNFSRNNNIGRVINYITFTISLLIKLLFFNSYDAILVVSNPPLIPFIAYLNKVIKKKPYFYLVHDVYPDIAAAVGAIKENGLPYKLMDKLNKISFKHSENLIVLGKDMKKIFLKKGAEEEKIRLIPNWSEKYKLSEEKSKNPFYQKNKLDKSFNIVYTGNIGRFHDVETILKLAEKARLELPDVKFVFVGDGFKKDMLENAIDEGLNNIILFDYQYGQDYIDILSGADIFISTLSQKIKGLGVPSKTYSYLAAGKPIIAIMEKDSEIGDLVVDHEIGIRVDSMEVIEVIEFIKEMQSNRVLYKKMSNRSYDLFIDEYERNVVTGKFVALIKN